MSYRHLKEIAEREQMRAARFEVKTVSELGDDGRATVDTADRAASASSVGAILDVNGTLQIGDPVLSVEGISGLPQIIGGSPWRTS